MKNKSTFLTIIFLVITIVTIFVLYTSCNNVAKEPSFIDSVKLVVDKETDKTIYNVTVTNTSDKSFKYNINFDSNDILSNSEYTYDLVSGNNIIKSSKLDTNNKLDSNIIEANSIKNYSLIVKANDDHFNYKLWITENNN